MDSTRRIFISHAKVDERLADALVDLLQTGVNVSQSDIFCSSLEGLGIPDGKDFLKYISDSLAGTKCVILLLTPNYFDSEFCLCELGAVWAIKKSIHPILVPPLEYSDVKAVLTRVELLNVTSRGDLDKLFDELKEELSITSAATSRWTVKRDSFLNSSHAIVAELPKPASVSREQFEQLKATYDEALKTLDERDREIEKLKRSIDEVKKLKDAEVVRDWELENSSLIERFEKLVKDTQEEMKKVPNIVRYLIFRYTVSDDEYGYLHPIDDKEKCDSANRALEEGYLRFSDDLFWLNRDDPSVGTILGLISNLSSFVQIDMGEVLKAQLAETNGFEFAISNARFWRKYLGLKETFYD